jgi:hypothetical protein
LLLKFISIKPVSIIKIESKQNLWKTNFLIGKTNCVFEFIHNPLLDSSKLKFSINNDFFERQQKLQENNFNVYLKYLNINTPLIAVINPMSASISQAIKTCYFKKKYYNEPKLTSDIMSLIAKFIINN